MIQPIRNQRQYERALETINYFMELKDRSQSETDLLETLSILIAHYEDQQFPVEYPDSISAIQFRMKQQGLKASDLIPYLGSIHTVKRVLRGQRGLSKQMIRALHDGLGIPYESLFGSAPERGAERESERGDHP